MTSSSDFPVSQTNPCPHCGGQHPAGATFCPVTGNPLNQGHLTCSNCGSVIESDWVRCPQCGVEVQRQPAVQTVVQPTGQPPAPSRRWIWLALVGGILFLGVILIGGFFLLRNLDIQKLIAGRVEEQTQLPSRTPLPTSTVLAVVLQPSETPMPPTETAPPNPPTSTGTSTEPPATPTPAEGPWEACTNTYLSRLRVGDKAYVAFDPPLANRVRERPNLDAAILGNIEPGEEIEILGGPACNTRWVWWEVRSLSTNLQGWTAEGDGEDYWLVPLEE